MVGGKARNLLHRDISEKRLAGHRVGAAPQRLGLIGAEAG